MHALEEGGVYATPATWRRWQIVRVLKLTDGVAHFRFYDRKFWRKPTLASFDKQDWSLGHVPMARQATDRWTLVHLGCIPVEESELEGFRIWEQDEGAGAFM